MRKTTAESIADLQEAIEVVTENLNVPRETAELICWKLPKWLLREIVRCNSGVDEND